MAEKREVTAKEVVAVFAGFGLMVVCLAVSVWIVAQAIR